MSIASMVDTRMALQQGVDKNKPSPAKSLGVSTGIVDQITRWIPTETITAYVALLALLAPLSRHAPSYQSRWILLGIVVAANPLVVLLLAMAKSQPGDDFSLPVFEMLIAPIAFAAWAFALPDTPLTSIAHYDLKWNAAILSITTTGIVLLANALHKSPDLDQVMTKEQGADPASPEPPG
jgi:hypothetical protein